jgi:hypothetical protein
MLLVIAGTLQSDPAAAQSSTDNAPAEEGAQLAVYLPLASSGSSTGEPEANPISVSVTTDASRLVTATIPIEGGVISATAANGTHFTLTIPADALLSDEEIMMTPLDNVSGIPLSAGLVAGVQLAPDGLRFIRPATLTIEAAPAVEAGLQAIGFGYQQSGDEFHLRPITASDNRFTLELMHFSGYGVTAGTEAEIETQATEHEPSALDDAFMQRVGAELGIPVGIKEVYQFILTKYLLPGQEGDLAALENGLFYFQTWLRVVEEKGLEREFSELIDDGWKQLLTGIGNAVDQGYTACKHGDASQVVKVLRWVRITRMLPELPRQEWISDYYLNTYMIPDAARCATFTMDFDSTVVREAPNQPGMGQAHDSHLRAENIRVRFDINGRLAAPSQAPLIYQSFNLAGTIPGCTPRLETTNATFNLVDARLNLNYAPGGSPKISVKFNPGRPYETVTHQCPHNYTLVISLDFWHIGFWRIHVPEWTADKLYAELKQWRFVGKSLYAELIVERPSNDGLYYRGTTWMVLAHAPE